MTDIWYTVSGSLFTFSLSLPSAYFPQHSLPELPHIIDVISLLHHHWINCSHSQCLPHFGCWHNIHLKWSSHTCSLSFQRKNVFLPTKNTLFNGATTLSLTSLNIRNFYVTLSINDTQHNNALLLWWASHFIYYYPECRSAFLFRHSA